MKVLNKTPDMQELMTTAIQEGVTSKDLFYNGDAYYNSFAFFDKILEDKDDNYKKQTIDRIFNNRPGDKFYDILVNFLTKKKNYPKLEPASIQRERLGPWRPVDGRHRAAFCAILGIVLMPVKDMMD